jgi:hypothetical protein
MSTPRLMSLLRQAAVLWVGAIFAVLTANAQSTPSTPSTSTDTLSTGESSSSSLIADSDSGGGAALPSAPAADGSGGGKGAGQEAGTKHGIFSFSHLAFEAGAGFNGPIGNDTGTTTIDGATYGPFITWGGNFTAGGGLHFSKRFSALIEYQFIDDKLPGALIYQLSQGNATGGNAHIWSFTLDPVIDLFPKHSNSVYVTGGGGFYRKVTSLTVPEEVEECYYYCGIGVENGLYGHISSNQGGANVGVGFSHRLGGVYGDGQAKLFAEARYLFIDSPPITASNGLGTTELIPVTFGVRW